MINVRRAVVEKVDSMQEYIGNMRGKMETLRKN